MCVNWSSQSIMVVILFSCETAAEIHGLHHASCGKDTQHGVEVEVLFINSLVQGVSQGFARGDIYCEALEYEQKKYL